MKKIIVVLLMFLIFSFFGKDVVYASNDNVGFSYTVKAKYQNSYYYSRYRETTYSLNPWKVNLTYSGEGKGTTSTFWLSEFSGDWYVQRVSATYNVKQGSGDKYFVASNNASKKDVSLSVENNNYSKRSYTISGYWDEETW